MNFDIENRAFHLANKIPVQLKTNQNILGKYEWTRFKSQPKKQSMYLIYIKCTNECSQNKKSVW